MRRILTMLFVSVFMLSLCPLHAQETETLVLIDTDMGKIKVKLFNDTAEQAEALMPEAIVSMETTPYGGVRALVRRELAPVGFQLEKPTIEDIILALVKGEKQ